MSVLYALKKKFKGKTVGGMSNKKLQMLALKWQMVEQNSKKMSEYARKVKQLYKNNEDLYQKWNEMKEDDPEFAKTNNEGRKLQAQEEAWVTKIVLLSRENEAHIREYVKELSEK